MKRILFIVNNLIIGGVEKVCWEIVSNLPSDKYKVDFLVAVDEEEEQYYDEKLHAYGCEIYKGGNT